MINYCGLLFFLILFLVVTQLVIPLLMLAIFGAMHPLRTILAR